MPAPSGIRLRESCQACALSKVRCTKEKPTCNRCAEKGTACRYLVTQKTGRKVRRYSVPSSSSSSSVVADNGASKHAAAAVTKTTTAAAMGALSALPDLDFRQDELLFGALDPPTMDAEGCDYEAVLSHTAQWDNPSPSFLYGQGPSRPKLMDSGFATSATSTGSSAPEQLVADFQILGPASLSVTAGGTRTALQLMERLCNRQSSAPPGDLTPLEAEMRTKRLKDDTKLVMGKVATMLESADSEDGYLLVLICLILSKAISIYAEVACFLISQHDDGLETPASSAPLPDYAAAHAAGDIHLGAPARTRRRDPKAISQLLDDLYQVRSALDHLLLRIQAYTDRDWTFGSEFSSARPSPPAQLPIPFSSAILKQLHEDLRKILISLSLQVLNELKQFWVR